MIVWHSLSLLLLFLNVKTTPMLSTRMWKALPLHLWGLVVIGMRTPRASSVLVVSATSPDPFDFSTGGSRLGRGSRKLQHAGGHEGERTHPGKGKLFMLCGRWHLDTLVLSTVELVGQGL